MSSENAIVVEGVSKCYDIYSSPFHRLLHLLLRRRVRAGEQFQALADISFHVARGETLAIIGRNGSGKSTLLQIICGTLSPNAGPVAVNGRSAALLELGAGFNPEFTGRENVYMNAAIYGLNRQEVDQRLPAILEFAEIGEFIDQPVKTYSSGMFVRLAFAVIVNLDADILIIDEALAVGDIYFTQKCMRFLREFSKVGTLLFVSHDTNAVVNLCSKAVWLDKGRMRLFGDATTVCKAYLGSFYPDTSEGDSDSEDREAATTRRYATEFGTGGAKILSVELLDADRRPLKLVDQPQRAYLRLNCEIRQQIDEPIVGFFIKDRLGQILFGDNSLGRLKGSRSLLPGRNYLVEFEFLLPQLASGEYSISVAVAEGDQRQHIQHHWIHDALAFKARANPDMTGLLALEDVRCTVQPEQERVHASQ